jgi:flagellar biosynthesis/type III secretory pathway protein FliH
MTTIDRQTPGSRFAWPAFGGAAKLPAAMRRPGAAQAAQKEHELGYDAGRAAGLAAAADEIRALKERLAASIRALEQTRVTIDAEQQRRLTELAHAVCSKVLDIELTTQRRVFDAFVRAGIEHLDATAATVRVRVNPVDRHLFDSPLDNGTARQGEIDSPDENLPHGATLPLVGIVVEADAAVPEGGCSIRTDERRVDYDPYGLLDQIFAELPRG